MFEKLLSLLGIIDNADMVYENLRDDSKKEDTTKRDYKFSDEEGFPATKKEAKKVSKKSTKKIEKVVAKKIEEEIER